MYVDGLEVFGADYPTQIWHDVMAFALKDVPYTAFPPPDPALMPPVHYIDSDALAQDDLLSHGGFVRATCVASGAVNPCPTTTTRAPTTTRPTTTTSPPTTTTTVFVLPPPPTGDLTPAANNRAGDYGVAGNDSSAGDHICAGDDGFAGDRLALMITDLDRRLDHSADASRRCENRANFVLFHAPIAGTA